MEILNLQKIQLSHVSDKFKIFLPLKVCVPFKGCLSIELQKLLYRNGCRYYSDPKKEYYEDLFGYLYVDEFGFITCGNMDSDYINLDYNDFTIISLFKKLKEFYMIDKII